MGVGVVVTVDVVMIIVDVVGVIVEVGFSKGTLYVVISNHRCCSINDGCCRSRDRLQHSNFYICTLGLQ